MPGYGTLGDRIAKLRVKNHMSQAELADFLYVNQGTISRWEKGVRFPERELMLKMAERFQVDPAFLLDAPLDKSTTVYMVDDDPAVLKSNMSSLKKVLPEAEIIGFASGNAALNALKKKKAQIVFLDIHLGDDSGLSFAKQMISLSPELNIIFCTNHAEHMKFAFGVHASGYIIKPASASDFEDEINHLRHPL
ncbi:MAG: response regulator [Firmicutes bacterium]|nr:response regulator [Bacillota bacterium]